ncbi:hypothetical protein LTS07_008196 [Exophiala sideris]|uniref:MOSC domain-containing protein n=1 Tax=Exophiala sideris TaxID=1016849 RepID=A0ABR0JFB1_9EURO|nr:hypothetical protein LTS07_008196 [Exophiala sideris]KAK5032920.1 hypothetical protein LTR13_006885 [Exophiala sideris]KAK5063405.1 hypothetical protein LTR69_004111 [Exophiala sideris]KAK5180762.1 hypothetical protein LTR44_007076 [Eurotiomycetes sp. CCFEE 6388]
MLAGLLRDSLSRLTPRAVIHTLSYSLLLFVIFLVTARVARDVLISRRRPKHLQHYGLIKSNLEDQYDPKYDRAENESVTTPILIKALYIHPIKSCAPIEVRRALLTKIGFAYDRCFAVAVEYEDKWQFISQRTKPRMALIKQELWLPHAASDPGDSLVQAGGCLIVNFPDPDPPVWTERVQAIFESWSLSAMPEVRFTVPLLPGTAQIDELGLKLRDFIIHSRTASGLDLGCIPEVAAALPKLKRFLKVPERQSLTLLRCTPDTLVPTNKNLAPLKYIGTPAMHGYTDQQPVHIINLPSVHATSPLLPKENQPLSALRFRANMYIFGAPAYDEETWKRFRILPKAATTERRARVAPALSVVCRTSRCTMPNVNPDTGLFEEENAPPERKKGKPQPSTTLVEYRTVESGNPAALGYLGMHCVPEDSGFKEAIDQGADLYVEVGDEIEVIETGHHLYGSTGDDY